MKKILFLALAVSLFVGCAKGPAGKPAAADGAKPAVKNPVVVVLDVQRIMREAKPSKEIQKSLNDWAESTMTDMRAKMEAYQKAKADKKYSRSRLAAMEKDLQQLRQKDNEEYQKKRQEAADKMKGIMDPLIQKLAKENGWDVILNKVDQVTIWSSNALDQTDYVIQQLDKLKSDTGKKTGKKAETPSKSSK